MNRSLARGIGIGLVVALSGLFLAAATSGRHQGFGRMGQQSRQNLAGESCSAPVIPSGSTISVAVFDMGMMMGSSNRMRLTAFPSAVAQGTVTMIVSNMGMRTHELVVLPLVDGQAVGTRAVNAEGKVDEATSLGEASNNCGSGSGDGILSGSRGWVTLTLAPGRYELLCNLPNHYSSGMHQEITVTK